MLDYYNCFIVLAQPQFLDVTVNERELLKITCLIRNIPDISTFEVLDPNGRPVDTVLGVFTVNNVNRTHAGTYTCIVRSTLDGSNVNAILQRWLFSVSCLHGYIIDVIVTVSGEQDVFTL